MSNFKPVIQSIPSEDRAKDIKDLDLFNSILPIERALGVQWCVESDTFQLRITLKDQPLTRRGILSTVSSVYDPLGFVAPVILAGKQILQQMCANNNDWDSPLSDELKSRWEIWRTSLFHLEHLRVQRCYKPPNFGPVKSVELHHFADASTVGYGQCTYVRLTNSVDKVHCSLVMAKARVVPLKPVTVPRLELTAAVLAVKVSSLLRRELDFPDMREFFWTDSTVVLGYINNESRRFHVFVANRVQQIRDHTEPNQWHHVKTSENPADSVSRGLTAEEFVQNSCWLRGPDFLWKDEIIYNDEKFMNPSELQNDPEVKVQSLAVHMTPVRSHFESERLNYFSDWTRAKKAIAACLQYKSLLKRSLRKPEKTVTSQNDDIGALTRIDALHELEIIRAVQYEAFQDELNVLHAIHRSIPTREVKKQLKKSSRLYRLDPFLDNEGIIRVGGRVNQAVCSYSEKHPIVLPRKHHITELVIRHCHEKSQHQGRGITTNEIRSNGFWIIGCSSAVSSFINKCITCRKLCSKPLEQKMAELPLDRVEIAPPFSYSGVDFFGPFLIKEGRKELKRYGVIFTCLASQAIHVEVANSLNTDSFLNALRRFLALRCPIRQLRSDQGTNFIGANNEIESAKREMHLKKVQDFLLKENCDFFSFKFNVPSASHMGGIWERQIRTVRSILSSMLNQSGSQLDDESLRTFMCEITAIVNSRPLTTENLYDPQSLEPLTPNHLLTMKSKILLPPPGVFQKADLYSRKRWRRIQHLSNEFWARWKKEYLQNLQKRQK